MTKERYQEIQSLISKLKECRAECDSLHDDEDSHHYSLCEHPCDPSERERAAKNKGILGDAFCDIDDAIEKLNSIEE